LRGLRNWPTGVGLIVDLHVEYLTCWGLLLFRRLTVEMLVVLLGIRTRAMNDTVTVVWRSIERVKLQWGRTRIDDVVLGASRNEHSEAGADRTATAQSAQSQDLNARATEVIAEARKMPLGQRRSDARGQAGRLRIAAEMKRWLSTK
jgi:hypothetical protein